MNTKACILLFAALAVRAAAQPVLLHGASADMPPSVSVSTYSGTVPATMAPVDLSGQILLLALPDTIAPDQQEHARAELQSFLQGGDLKNMRLAVLRGEEFLQEDPFRTRAQIQAALRRTFARQPDQAAEAAPYPAAKLYRWLVQTAAQFGSQWSSLVIVGSLPDVDAPMREYATAYLASRFQAQRIRVSYWNPGGPAPAWLGEICRATGGALLANGLPGATEPPADAPVWREISWPPPTDVRGFLLYRAGLTVTPGGPAVEFPAVAVHAGAELPDLETYAALRRSIETLRALTSGPKPTEEQVGQIRAALQQALRINPSEPEALRLAADFYARFNDYATVAQFLAILAETKPKDAALLAELGHAHFAAQQLPQAETVLLRAHDAGADSARLSEELARIHISRADDAGAIPFLDESLKKDPKQPALWFLRADAAGRLKDWKMQSASLESGTWRSTANWIAGPRWCAFISTTSKPTRRCATSAW